MTNSKNTKRALLSSVVALFLCFAMLLGTTYAWFTDSVTSGSNIIQSGTLDVDLVDADGNSMEGQIIEFVATDGRAQNLILWEPGCTYKTEPVYVVNKGTLDLKYEIIINGIVGNAKLLEAIEWTVTVGDVTTALEDLKGVLPAGEKTAAIVLTGHMKETAGNEYQGLTAEGISIAVFATQYTAEEDSFNDQYDANAEYAAQTMLKNVAAVAAGETATVKLESDGYVVINETNAIGAEVAGDVTLDLNGKTLFVKVEDGDAHMSLFNIVRGGKLTVTGNGTIEMVSGKNESKVTAIFNNTSGTLVIENGTYKMDVKTYAQGSLIPTIIDNNGNAAGATTTINGGDFYHTRNMFRNFPSNNGITQLTINGGTFNGKADDWAAIWNQKASSITNEGQSLITINGGEFNYVEISNEFETGVTIADGVVVPVPVSTVAELTNAIAVGGTVVLTDDIDMGSTKLTVAKDLVLDLNGYTVSGTCEGSQSYLFMVKNGVTMDIKDSSAAQTGKIAYTQGTSSVGWAIDLEGQLNLYSGTIELIGESWDIAYCVDVRPNAWGTNYNEETVFTMYGGKLVSSFDGIRVASSSSDSYTNIVAKFVMKGGEIDAARDGIFMQQSNTAYDTLTVEINGGVVKGTRPIRVYGSDATSVNAGTAKPMTITAKAASLVLVGALDTSYTWHTEGKIAYKGGMTLDNLNQYSTITLN